MRGNIGYKKAGNRTVEEDTNFPQRTLTLDLMGNGCAEPVIEREHADVELKERLDSGKQTCHSVGSMTLYPPTSNSPRTQKAPAATIFGPAFPCCAGR